MTQKTHRRVPLGSPIFPNRPPLSPEEKARRKAQREEFAQRCRVIFDRVYPELVTDHYDWSIMIEPDSGDYFIAPDPEVAFQKARQKHPTAQILEKRLNETGTVGRI
jgi:hypothetical protein